MEEVFVVLMLASKPTSLRQIKTFLIKQKSNLKKKQMKLAVITALTNSIKVNQSQQLFMSIVAEVTQRTINTMNKKSISFKLKKNLTTK